MTRAALLVPAALAAALLLAGCTGTDDVSASSSPRASGSLDAPSSSPTVTDGLDSPEATPTPDSASYPTASDLRTAAVAAGLECNEPSDVTAVAPAMSALACGDLELTVYATAADRDTVVNKALGDEKSTRVFLVGANWLIAAPDGNDSIELVDLIPGLGGFVVPQGS